jgi:hypothetical protein
MTAKALELGLVLACASSLAQAGDPEISLSTGLEYSTGSYGGEDDIEEMYVPVTGFIYFDRVALSINVPYLSVRAPSGTSVTDPGGEPVLGSGEITTESGLGDVVVGMTVFDVFSNYERGIALDLTGKVKFGTADPDKGLGTGEMDYLVRADLYKFFNRFMLMGSGGYRVRSDPAGVDLENGLLGSVGASYALGDTSSIGLLYDYREASLQDSDALSEMTLYSTHGLSESWRLQLYAFAGFSDSSPDWGAGVSVSMN